MRWLDFLICLVIVSALAWLQGYTYGKAKVYHEWGVKQAAIEAEAREAELEAESISARSAERIAAKEKALNDQAKQQNVEWRKRLARLPDCRVPRSIGVQLDTTSGASKAPSVAELSDTSPDAAALEQMVRLADELDTVRENYQRARINIDRLIEARHWYEELRERYNQGESK